MIRKTPKIQDKSSYNKKKKLPIFYKIFLSLIIFFGLILFYFIVLVSSSPRSIDFVTNRIQENLDYNYQQRVKISKTFIKFTSYGSFKITIKNVRILYNDISANKESKSIDSLKYFNIPKVEAEFSLIDLMFLKLNPYKIKIFQPEIFINNTQELNYVIKDTHEDKDSQIETNQQFIVFIEFLSSLRNKKNPIENFEIEDAKIVFQTSKVNTVLVIKNSKILTKINNDSLDIFMQNQIFFASNKSEFKTDSSCKLSKINGLKCDINVFNFIPNSIASFHPKLEDLKNIDSSINGLIKVEINPEKSINNFIFNLRADKGSFELKNFFKDKINFQQMKIDGSFDYAKKLLNIKDINAVLISDIANQTEILNPKINMSLSILMSENNQTKYDFKINLENVLTNEIDRFWLINLSQKGVRDWVINHIRSGMINNAKAEFIMIENNSELDIKKIDAQLNFKNLDLNYDSNFPEIKNLSGVAFFSENDIKISIDSGNVLKSNISETTVSIDDFNMPINILKIKGNLTGPASDGLKHASNNSEFQIQVDKYFNGSSKSSFNINIPLIDEIDLKKTFIEIKSDISKIDNDFISGNISVLSKKDLESNAFYTLIDLKNCEINNKEFKIYKPNSEDARLSFVVDVGKKNLAIKDIFYGNNDSLNNNKIKASMDFLYSPFTLTKLKINNKNIANSSYDLSYVLDNIKSNLSLSVKGKSLDISGIINSKIFNKDSNISPNNYKIDIALDSLKLANKKQLKSVNLNLTCKQKICFAGYLNAIISKQKKDSKNINFKIIKNTKNDNYSIDGQVQDVGFIIEGLGISNLVLGGSAKINILQNIIDKKLVLTGNINISNDITIFESEKVKKLSSNDLFSQIKDKIFSSGKTIFSSVVVDFSLQDSDLILESVVANNFKIGITAKGKLNLAEGSSEIKGMIVPGYIINSLFGLGKIPVLGNVISGVLTGGEGGGIFSIRYNYIKNANDKEGKFSTNKVSAFMPSSLSNLFD